MNTNERAGAPAPDPRPRREPQRTLSGRHTLGSLPESQEPADSAPVLNLPLPWQSAEDTEPLSTIYGAQWQAARQRVEDLDPMTRRLLGRMLDLVEEGWTAALELQRWYENDPARALETDDYGHLLEFVDADVIDLFRTIAAGIAELVPGKAGWEAEADPEGVESEIDEFMRYMTVLRLAVQAGGVPDAFRALVVSVAERLAGWGDELAAVVAAWGTELERRVPAIRG
ncbi:MAG TPA: hypothetical protein VHG08_19255 [Longimicrobium sp.]|nr:hypothetical protein [Longimicrobium sp.]